MNFPQRRKKLSGLFLPVAPLRQAPVRLWLAGVLLFFGIAIPALAQLDTGSIAGVITDPSARVVPGASVAALETTTGTSYATVSSSVGYYVFPALRPGTYQVKVTANGFKTDVVNGVQVSIGVATSRDIKLSLGASTENVTVTAGSVSLEKETSDVDDSITPEQVQDLPLAVTGALRSITSMEFLVPGAVGPGTSSGGSGFQMTKIAGGQEEGTDYLVDGITTNRMQNGSGSVDILTPSVDAVNEFHVELSGLPAEMGRTTGGIANFNTRGGTNEYHGTVYDFFKNAVLDGNNWFNNGYLATTKDPATRQTLKRPSDTKNDYGVTLGGPLRIPHVYNGRDKTFFFFNWEQLNYHTGSAVTSLIPTPAVLGSDGQYFDFSSSLGGPILKSDGTQAYACDGTTPLYYGEIFDPAQESNGCRTVPFKDNNGQLNKIPVSRESSVAKAVLQYMPKPNLTGGTNNYAYSTTDSLMQTAISLRVDQNIGANHKVWAFVHERENTDQGNGLNLPPPLNSGGGGDVDQKAKLLRAGWEWILRPTLINAVTIGANRSNNYNKSRAANMGVDWDTKLGIANGSGPVFPGFEFNGSPYPSFGENTYSQDVDNALVVNDIVHWQRGAHSIKFGAETQYHQFSFISKIGGTCSGTSGCFSFWDNQTASDTTYWGRDGNSFAAFLIGQAGTADAIKQLHAPRWITHFGSFYLQDDWKLMHNLTLNLGMRWSVDTPRQEAEGDTTNFDPTKPNIGASGYPGSLVFAGKGAGRNGNKGETWADVYYKDFEPRVGFSWAPSFLHDRDVLRGSGGIYYGPLVYADFGQGTMRGFTQEQTLFTGDPLSGPQVDSGLPVLTNTPNLDSTQANGQSIDSVGKNNGKPAMVMSWTLENQYQINPNLYVSVGYIGNHATRLHGLIDYPNDIPLKYLSMGTCLWWWAAAPCPNGWNSPALEPYANFSCASGCTWGISEPTEQALRPFPQYGYINQDSYLQNVGQSTYNALTVKLEQKFHNGFNILASYTFSKTLTDADAIQPYYSTLQNQGGTQNPYNHKAEKAVSNEDIPNNFVVSYLYELPLGHGKKFLANSSRPVNAVVSGWRISGVQRYMSGQPISFWGANGIPGMDNGIRPNRVANQPVRRQGKFNPFNFVPDGKSAYDHSSNTCQQNYWNCSAFADPNPNPGINVPYVFGSMPRNSADIRGFKFVDEDFGINKHLPIREGISVDFRGEMFNAFNRHAFNKPDSGVQDNNFGQVGSTLLGPRNVQFMLKINY